MSNVVNLKFCNKIGTANLDGNIFNKDSYEKITNSKEFKNKVSSKRLYLVDNNLLAIYNKRNNLNPYIINPNNIIGYVTRISDEDIDIIVTNDKYSRMIHDEDAVYASPDTIIDLETKNDDGSINIIDIVSISILDKLSTDMILNNKI